MSAAVREDGNDEPMMEVNMTPLIDVMLVLLIMFIITIPVQTHAVKIDLPVPNDAPTNVDPEKNKIMIDPAGTITWNGTPVDLAQLTQYLEQTKTLPVEPELQVQPDPYARYIVVDRVMAVIKRSGVGKLGFVGNEQYARAF
ncbi:MULTISPECIES: ExbD/TolR family protein [Sphingopyxis]|jgi:biopolymer transport protein ExbD|uniref:Biopolymer transport protein ExbD/TolR n=1 Tax=Sphingopyxis granuli TaxID=267128 RepID=A0AA86GVS3_9SPHN|nr:MULTISPECIES: biopolymer transporter ExbD [Sphingopyxis]AMG76322.1 Biopolymer transport protein ExbD/TolR [Sphingopyxis granuli]APW73888.1 biopolymer transporter ExbD [Sphingopyxis granuli]AVA15218.1 biopolymer transporter ExbD [Sphingopyxis sp. MG]ODU30026.1 MAG: biopolymer transporter ExbD [Sphingopyxis sp. SCN 67-31]QUM72978.1 biopolymer transporter ExbD [Sphingopyxis granuli]